MLPLIPSEPHVITFVYTGTLPQWNLTDTGVLPLCVLSNQSARKLSWRLM